jgi:hypothetical protein
LPPPFFFFFFFFFCRHTLCHAGILFYCLNPFSFLSDNFPESDSEAMVNVRLARERRGHDEQAHPEYTLDDYMTALRARIGPISNFGQNLLSPCVHALSALWPESTSRLDAHQLSLKLEGAQDRLDEWRESAARAGADEALTFVLSWYEDINLDGLQTLRSNSKWTEDPELVKQRKRRAHAIAQYAGCHQWTPDLCDPADKVDPFTGEELAVFASDSEDYADSEDAGEDPADIGDAGIDPAGTGTSAPGTSTSDPGTSDPGTSAPPPEGSA